jgi:4,5-DOPA dioxygenase extradiol
VLRELAALRRRYIEYENQQLTDRILFGVAFNPDENPLNVPLVQVSLFDNEDPDMHYRLGEAVAALREEGVVIIGAGMTVHNLRLIGRHWGEAEPLPFTVSFDNALKEAVEAPAKERQDRMRDATKKPDARQAHPTMDHLMPLYVAAGAAGGDAGKQTWTFHENCLGWGQFRFGDVPE